MEHTDLDTTVLDARLAAAKEASYRLAQATTAEKDAALERSPALLRDRADEIIAANELDLAAGRENGLATGLLDRLALDERRVARTRRRRARGHRPDRPDRRDGERSTRCRTGCASTRCACRSGSSAPSTRPARTSRSTSPRSRSRAATPSCCAAAARPRRPTACSSRCCATRSTPWGCPPTPCRPSTSSAAPARVTSCRPATTSTCSSRAAAPGSSAPSSTSRACPSSRPAPASCTCSSTRARARTGPSRSCTTPRCSGRASATRSRRCSCTATPPSGCCRRCIERLEASGVTVHADERVRALRPEARARRPTRTGRPST